MTNIDILATGRSIDLKAVEDAAFITCMQRYKWLTDRNKIIVAVDELYGGDSTEELHYIYQQVEVRTWKASSIRNERRAQNRYPPVIASRALRAQKVLSAWVRRKLQTRSGILANKVIPPQMLVMMVDVDMSCALKPDLDNCIPLFLIKPLGSDVRWIRQLSFHHSINWGHYFCFETIKKTPYESDVLADRVDVRYFPVKEWEEADHSS